jgi:tetratricopeptide (TPR) repeat protein
LPVLAAVLLVLAAAVVWQIFLKKKVAPTTAPQKSIAVLPFEDLSQSKNNEYYWDFARAEKEYKLAIELNPGYATARQYYGFFLADLGRHEEARKILNDSIEYSKENYVPSTAIAWIFSALGEKEQAFARLEQAFRERDPYLIMYLKTVHMFNPLRSDPRYGALLRRIGLEK